MEKKINENAQLKYLYIFPFYILQKINQAITDKSNVIRAAIVALFLICLTFPDVVFHHASLRVSDQAAGAEHHIPIAAKYFTASTQPWWNGLGDYGGAFFQSDPMMEFMKYSLWHHESPYWNPYSGSGQLGPETLVDQKFSIFTIAYAALGGGSHTFTILLLLLYFLGTFFIYRIAAEKLELSLLASVATAFIFLLTGYNTANLGSNISISYILAPACIYFSLSFADNPSTSRFIGIICSFIALLSCTFFPTTIASLISIYVISLGYLCILKKRKNLSMKNIIHLANFHTFAVILSFAVLCFLYLPILESFKSTDVLGMYLQRQFTPVHWPGILSMFVPKHFFSSYGAAGENAAAVMSIIQNTAYHFGVVVLAFVGCAFTKKREKLTPIVLACGILSIIILCRIFGLPILSNMFSVIPIIGHIGCPYWWAATALPMCVLAGIGINNLQQRIAWLVPPLLIMGLGFILAFAIWYEYVVLPPHLAYNHSHITGLAALLIITCVLLVGSKYIQNNKYHLITITSLVAVMVIELFIHSQFNHYQTNDNFTNPPPEIAFLRSNIGPYKTMTIGNLYGPMHGLRPELGSAYQIPDITSLNEGITQNYLQHFNKVISMGGINPISPMFPTLLYFPDKPQINKINWSELDLLGVKYIIAPTDFTHYKEEFLKLGLPMVFQTSVETIYENPNVIPRAFAIPFQKQKITDPITLPENFRTIIQPVDITKYHNAEVQLKGNTSKPALIVLSDNWNQNWKAYVNGVITPIIVVNGIFRGVWVSEGQYTIDMRYSPATLGISIFISSIALIFILFLIIFSKKFNLYLSIKKSNSSNKLKEEIRD